MAGRNSRGVRQHLELIPSSFAVRLVGLAESLTLPAHCSTVYFIKKTDHARNARFS